MDIESYRIDNGEFKKQKKRRDIVREDETIIFMIQISTGRKCVCMRTNTSINQIKPRNRFYKKVELFATYHHPAIIEFIGFAEFRHKGCIYLVEPEKCSLEDIISNSALGNPDLLWDDTHKLIIAYGIARAMKYLHSHDILLQNLKLDNIFLDSNLFPYIIDFGFLYSIEDLSHIPKSNIVRIEFCNTAPELLADYEENRNKKPHEVFAYSLILYRLMTELELCQNVNIFDYFDKMIKNQRPEFPPDNSLDEKWKNLIQQCWNQDPESRPTFQQICNILESPEFVSTIDKDLFDSYKELLDKA